MTAPPLIDAPRRAGLPPEGLPPEGLPPEGLPPEGLPPEVKVFGVASFFTDVAADMVRPLLPLFLRNVLRASAADMGVIEGAAEAAASFLKIASGWINDHVRSPRTRKLIVVAGYALAAFARPLTAAATRPMHVLLTRVTDRIGKGIRTPPRDAWIADVTEPAARGRAFGFHRALDNAGAFCGPLVALALHRLAHLSLRTIFALSVIPAILAVLTLVAGLRAPRELEKQQGKKADPATPAARSRLGAALWVYLGIVALFTLGNASDAFLLLRSNQVGVPEWGLLLVATGHSGLTALLNMPLGALSDRLGRRRTIVIGWVVYAGVYLGFAHAGTVPAVLGLYAAYSAYYALTEGAERALLASLAPQAVRGRAFGAFHACVGFATLPGNILFGELWDHATPAVAFEVAAALALVAAVGLLLLVRETPERVGDPR